MIEFTISFSARETIVDELREMAAERGITPEQLIKRFIDDGLQKTDGNSPSLNGRDLDDYFVKNGVLKPK